MLSDFLNGEVNSPVEPPKSLGAQAAVLPYDAVAKALSPPYISVLREVFDHFDEDKDQGLNISEFSKLVVCTRILFALIPSLTKRVRICFCTL